MVAVVSKDLSVELQRSFKHGNDQTSFVRRSFLLALWRTDWRRVKTRAKKTTEEVCRNLGQR